MLLFFVAEYNFIFSLALILAAGIAAIEGIALLFGYSLAQAVEDIMPTNGTHDVFSSGSAKHISLYRWLCLDRLPVLVWFILWLLGFSLSGLVFNFILSNSSLLAPSLLLSMPVSVIAALTVCRISAASLSRRLPRVDTLHEVQTSLNGLVAKVTDNIAAHHQPARAVCQDQFGYKHTVLVMPVEKDMQFEPGELVVLVEERQSVWLVVAFSS